MSWKLPRDWKQQEALTAIKLNTEIRDKMIYLFDKPHTVLTVRDVNYTTTSTSWVTVDDRVFTLNVETFGGDVIVELHGLVDTNSGVQRVDLDLWIDDSYYLSSGAATPNSFGFASSQGRFTGSDRTLAGFKVLTNLPAGIHKFQLRWKVSGATGTLRTVDVPLQLVVREL